MRASFSASALSRNRIKTQVKKFVLDFAVDKVAQPDWLTLFIDQKNSHWKNEKQTTTVIEINVISSIYRLEFH